MDLVSWLRAVMDMLESDARSHLDLRPDEPYWPALALAEIGAKRRIVRDLSAIVLYPERRELSLPAGYVDALEHILRLLALPYADEPGYRDEWRPCGQP